jgi:hypothetical protein
VVRAPGQGFNFLYGACVAGGKALVHHFGQLAGGLRHGLIAFRAGGLYFPGHIHQREETAVVAVDYGLNVRLFGHFAQGGEIVGIIEFAA